MIDRSRSNTPFAGTASLAANSDDASRFEQDVLEALSSRGYPETASFAVRLALQEALANAFVHGNRSDPAKRVTVEYRVDDDELELEIIDEGAGFDPQSVPDPTADENITIPAGRGIMLMRSFMTDVQFLPPGNRVRMRYRRGD